MIGVVFGHILTRYFCPAVRKQHGLWDSARGVGRKVLLLLDNFSGHTPPEPNFFKSLERRFGVRVDFLPPNTPSHYQPLDQGIIAAFKAKYRRDLLRKVIQFWEKPRPSGHVSKTVQRPSALDWPAWMMGGAPTFSML